MLLIQQDTALLSAFPPENLYCEKDRKYTKWYSVAANGTRIYIPKSEKEKAMLLAEKMLISTRLKSNKQELAAVEKYLAASSDSQEAIRGLLEPDSKYSDLLFPFHPAQNAEVAKWQSEDFETNTSFLQHLVHRSPSGNILRSKSELAIDMFLFEKNIPFRYECKLEFEDGSCIYPDFTIMMPDGRLKYWEHCGMMDSPEYTEYFQKRVGVYSRNGIYIGESLFFTFETTLAPLQISDIEYTFQNIMMSV